MLHATNDLPLFRAIPALSQWTNLRSMANRLRAAVLIAACALMLLTLASTAQAGNLVANTNITGISPGAGFGFGYGFAFTANTSGLVTELGLYNPVSVAHPEGASGTHGILLAHIDTFTSDTNMSGANFGGNIGTSTVLGVADVNMTGSTSNAYNYASLGTPVQLQAGQSYLLVAEEGTTNWSGGTQNTVTLDPNFSALSNGFVEYENNGGPNFGTPIVGGAYDNFGIPTYGGGSSGGPVDLVFQPVPEPGSAVLLFVGACGLVAARRVIRRRCAG